MKYLVFSCLMCFLICCQAVEVGISDAERKEALVGKWELDETCISNGTPCKWTKVSKNEAKTLDLDKDGSAKGTFLPECIENATYSFKDNTLAFDYRNCKIGFPRFMVTSLTSSQLTINGIGCIEECSYRFKAK